MRRLCTVSVALAASVFLSYYLLPATALPWLVGVCALAALCAFAFRKKKRAAYRIFLCALGLWAGFCLCLLQRETTFRIASDWDETEQSVELRVLEYPVESANYIRLHAECTESPRLGIMLYDYQKRTGEYEPGDLIRATARFRRADLRYGERNDSYVSKNVWLTGTLREAERSGEGRSDSLRTAAARCCRKISDTVGALFPGRTGIFMRSLMLGDKSDFYSDLPLYASMRGAGFMHIVAVSGMHIAFLAGLLQLLFGARPLPSVIGILLIWVFVFLTGASPSAVRAGLMQSILLMAPIFRRENDAPTALAFALALILCMNPCSCASISLQLSFSAMAGMLLMAEPLRDAMLRALGIPEDEDSRRESAFRMHLRRLLRVPVSAVAASLAVLAASTPVSVLHFGTLALWSPLTSLLGLWAVPLCFCGGWLTWLTALLSLPAAGIPCLVTTVLAKYLIGLTSLISSLPHSLLGMRTPQMLLWLALCYALGFLGWQNRRAGSRMRVLLPIGLGALALAAAIFSSGLRYRSGEAVIAVLDVGQGECVCMLSGDETVMFDCGGTGTLSDAGETAATWLEGAGRNTVDLLVLSHLHTDHANGVPMLLELIPVKEIVLSPDADRDEELLQQILKSAERHGTVIHELREDELRQSDRIRLSLFAPPETGNENERCIISLATAGEYDMLFTGDAPGESELALTAQHELPDAELLVVGHHGSRTSTEPALLEALRAENAVISVGRNNSYGHPTWEVLERLRSENMRIYRTDLNGTVEIRVA